MIEVPSTCAAHADAIVLEMAGQLAGERRRTLRAHVRGCAHCRAVWDRAAAAERLALGEARLDRGWSYLAGELAAPARAPAGAPAPARAWIGAVAAAGALATAVALWPARAPDDEWSARGEAAVSSALSLRVLRATPSAGGFAVHDLGTQPDVSVGDQLIPLVSNTSASPRTVTLWIARPGEAPRRWGEPRPVPAGATDVRGEALRVESAWAGQALEVWAVFEAGPPRAAPPTNGGLAKDGPDGLSMRKIMVRVTSEATP